MLNSEDQSVTEQPAPRRRRSATRPAGPPALPVFNVGQPTQSEDSKLEAKKPEAESGRKVGTKKSGQKTQEPKRASGRNAPKKASRERKSAKTKSSSKLQQSLVGDDPELAQTPQSLEQTARHRQANHPEPGDAPSEQAGESTENASEDSGQKAKRKVAQRRGSAAKKQTGEAGNSETEDAVASALEKVAETKRDQAPSDQGNEPEPDLESLTAAIAGEGPNPIWSPLPPLSLAKGRSRTKKPQLDGAAAGVVVAAAESRRTVRMQTHPRLQTATLLKTKLTLKPMRRLTANPVPVVADGVDGETPRTPETKRWCVNPVPAGGGPQTK